MIFISHRGNINGRDTTTENKPSHIIDVINTGIDVEIDLWYIDNFYLGHDKPQYLITFEWLQLRKNNIWVHCKNVQAIEKLSGTDIHYFWHENDMVTLTSKGIIWAYPGKQPIKNSIAVLPELYNDSVESCLGVCSDNIQAYKN